MRDGARGSLPVHLLLRRSASRSTAPAWERNGTRLEWLVLGRSKKLTDRQTLRIERLSTIECTHVNNQIDQCIEIAHRANVANFRTLNSEFFSLAVDAFARGPLVVDDRCRADWYDPVSHA